MAKSLDLILKSFNFGFLVVDLGHISVFSVIDLLIYLFVLHELQIGFSLHLFRGRLQLDLNLLSPFPLLFVRLFVFDYLALTFVHDLEEKVFHQAHSLLIVFRHLHINIAIITLTYSFELLLECLRVLQNVLDSHKPIPL